MKVYISRGVVAIGKMSRNKLFPSKIKLFPLKIENVQSHIMAEVKDPS